MNKKSSGVSYVDAARASPLDRTRARSAAEERNQLVGRKPLQGYVDIFGYSSAAGGWLFNGWIPRPMDLEQSSVVSCTAQYARSRCNGEATLAFYRRDDLDQNAVGVIALLPGSSRAVGALQHVAFSLEGREYLARTGDFTTRLLDQDIVERVRLNLLHQAIAGRNREYLLGITARQGYEGKDTLSSLTDRALIEIDEAIFCPPAGVLLKGWLLSSPGVVNRIRVRSGSLSGDVRLESAVRVDRPDVITAVGAEQGFSDPGCGFISYVPGVVSNGDALYLEIEFADGEFGFKPLKLSKRTGIDAIRQILKGVEVRPSEIDEIFDLTLGPAVSALNEARLRDAPVFKERCFGDMPENPVCTLIIPLYGRVDFLEYQMAIFSREPPTGPLEILYVLDDPPKQRELEGLARSTYERFGIPFRLLLLQSNLGFAPASNVGLRAAGGEYVCFMNSDVFPISDGWVTSLIAALKKNPDIGIIGARLLFEDGSIQHEGCRYVPLSEFGEWHFVDHVGKGRRPTVGNAIQRHPAVTGACMMMRRAHAEALGGFDEAYVVGDFEDSDLCLKTAARGLTSAVHSEVEMYHLERRSQAPPSEGWRMNLTLYNAWVHQRRWFADDSAPIFATDGSAP